jgi:hypothetical protein
LKIIEEAISMLTSEVFRKDEVLFSLTTPIYIQKGEQLYIMKSSEWMTVKDR